MKIVRFEREQGVEFGALEDDKIRKLRGDYQNGFSETDTVVDSGECHLLAPVRPRQIVCVGRNYADHAAELGNPVPTEPLLFLKSPTAVIGPGQSIAYPGLSSRVEHEAEIAVVIGSLAHQVSAADAMSHVLGVTLSNDVTARDIQLSDPQWTRGKSFYTSLPIGPYVDTDVDVADLDIECSVNGTLRQSGTTKDFIFDVPYLIEYITRLILLEAGDVILTGTPAGVSRLEPGDTLCTFSSQLGELTNPIVAESTERRLR